MRKPRIKICGLTNLEDAGLAADLGADFLGFIFYPKSPRAVGWSEFRGMRPRLPAVKRVYVQVRPDLDELRRAMEEGFDFFQLYFPVGEDPERVRAWTTTVGRERLWLAPKIAPDEDFPRDLLEFADTFLIDTYRKESFGGTGETGDWGRFWDWKEMASEKRWGLAGGLKPENIRDALRQTDASIVDVSSGIEERPGKKDPVRMRQFIEACNEA